MRISLLIATRNRRDSLERCLAAVGRARAPGPLQVIVVDNGSSDATAALLDGCARTAPFTLVSLREPEPGKSRALNAGLARATGDVIVFSDDDVYLAPDYFERLADILEHNDVSYCGGRILLHDPTDLPMAIRTTNKPERFPPHSFIAAGAIGGGNMAFRREVLEAIGGFDPILGPPTAFACEDVDLVARASAAGFVGGYFPELLVYHHHGRKTRAEETALARNYAWGRGAYFAKFILARGTRDQYLRRCYWHWRAVSLRVVRQEMWGALRYVLARLFTGAGGSPAMPVRPADPTRQAVRTG